MGKFGKMTRPQMAWYIQRNRKRREAQKAQAVQNKKEQTG